MGYHILLDTIPSFCSNPNGTYHTVIYSKYNVLVRIERDEVKPSIEMATNIANTLNISLDFLVGQTDVAFDQDALERITDISTLPQDDKQFMLRAIDGLLRDIKTRKAYAS